MPTLFWKNGTEWKTYDGELSAKGLTGDDGVVVRLAKGLAAWVEARALGKAQKKRGPHHVTESARACSDSAH